MALRFRCSMKLFAGVRLKFGKRAVGISGGVPGFRVGVDSPGKRSYGRANHSLPIGGPTNIRLVSDSGIRWLSRRVEVIITFRENAHRTAECGGRMPRGRQSSHAM